MDPRIDIHLARRKCSIISNMLSLGANCRECKSYIRQPRCFWYHEKSNQFLRTHDTKKGRPDTRVTLARHRWSWCLASKETSKLFKIPIIPFSRKKDLNTAHSKPHKRPDRFSIIYLSETSRRCASSNAFYVFPAAERNLGQDSGVGSQDACGGCAARMRACPRPARFEMETFIILSSWWFWNWESVCCRRCKRKLTWFTRKAARRN